VNPRSSFLGTRERDEAPVVLLGVPLDDTTTFRAGTRDGPAAIRAASDCLETYSPVLDRCLETDCRVADHGDLELRRGATGASLAAIGVAVAGILDQAATPVLLGGEHLLSLPAIQEVHRRHPDLLVLQLDAHADLREDYEGRRLSHATVMRRVLEVVGEASLWQVGIRSGTRQEWAWMRRAGSLVPLTELPGRLAGLGDRPLYVTLDLDVLDPACLPGTGAPEPGGLDFAELGGILARLAGRRIAGADVVELAPRLDPTGASAVVAAKAVRELLLAVRFDNLASTG
jgi:agmatinase